MKLLDILKQLDGQQKLAIKQNVRDLVDNIYKGDVKEFFEISGEEYRPIYENFEVQQIFADKDTLVIRVEKNG